MFYKRVLIFIIGFFILMITSPMLNAHAGSNPTDAVPPTLLSEGIMVMDADSGLVLYEKNGYAQYMPASTTKMMTALLVIEHLELDQMLTVGPKPPYAEGASMGFKEGEIVSVEDLLYALLLHSANDAAEILAEGVSGSVDAFAQLMNAKAKELGCLNSNFTNPSGLTDENHKTTPFDLSLITRAVSNQPELVLINKTYSHELATTNLLPETNRWATNKNALLKKNNKLYYEPTIVAKTGWTPDAGYSHTAVAEKDGKRYVVTVMHAANQQNYWEESVKLFNWAFDTFDVSKIYNKSQLIKQLPLKGDDVLDLVAEDDFYYVSTLSATKPEAVLRFNEEIALTADVKKGEVLGYASVLVAGKEIGKINLVATKDVTLNVKSEAAVTKTSNFGKILKWTGIIIGGILLLFLVFILIIRSIVTRQKKKKRLQRIYEHRRNNLVNRKQES